MTEIHDLIELALRLEHCRSLPPGLLRHREPRARDGPRRYPEPLRRKESLRRAHSASEVSTYGGSR